MSEREILKHLDSAFQAEPAYLESEEHYYQLADARLSVFRSPTEWVMVFELVRYSSRLYAPSERFMRDYYLYGNCLTQEGFIVSEPLWEQDDQVPFDPTGMTWQARRSAFWYYWQGVRHECRPTEAEYRQAGIIPELLPFSEYAEYLENSDYLAPIEWLRFLCHYLDHPFFADEAHLRQVIRSVLSDPSAETRLRLVLQTRSWEYPGWGEPLSPKTSFRQIARIIRTGEARLWTEGAFQPTSDWRYWEERAREEEPHWRTALQILSSAYARAQGGVPARSGEDFVIERPVVVVAEPFVGLLEKPAEEVWSSLRQSDEAFAQWLAGQRVALRSGERFREWLVRVAYRVISPSASSEAP